jgi:signal transduction histidine kinase/DNA-binding response OmpR family regulator
MKLMQPEIAYVFVGGFYLAMSVLHFILYMYNRHRKVNLVYSLGMGIAFINFVFVPIAVDPNSAGDKINILLSTLSNGTILYFISYYVISYLAPKYKQRIQSFGWCYIAGFVLLAISYPVKNIFYTIDLILRSSLYMVVAASTVIGLLKKVPNFILIVIATVLLVAADILVADFFGIWGRGNYPASRTLIVLIGFTAPFIAYSIFLSKDLALTSKKFIKEHIMNERLSREKYEQELITRKLLESQNIELERSVFERTRKISMQKEELEIQAEKIQEIDKIKSRFFANISHEFRTPLTLIQSPIKKRLSEATDPKDVRELSIIYQNSTRLLQLVNQLLDLSKIESGSIALRASKTELITTLKPMVEAFQSLAEVKMVNFTIDFPALAIPIYADHEKLEKVINNLLSNAFKFTPQGGEVNVSVRSFPPDENFKEGAAEIRVKDSGIGIAREHQQKVFNRFYQVDNSQTRAFDGTGIGLAITKEFVELHKGEITLSSELGIGTCFTVRLPLGNVHILSDEFTEHEQSVQKESDTIEIPEQVEPEPIPCAYTETILIIEDNADLRYYIKENLPQHFHILEAGDGAVGIELGLREIPDLIISDLMMPHVDGLQVCKKLKADERTSHVPIILLTAKTDIESKLEGLNTGADDYIPKPFDMDELKLRVRNLIELRKKLQVKYANQVILKPKELQVQSTDERFLQKVLAIAENHMSNTNFGVDMFAQEAGMSTAQLYRKINALTGQTPNDFIRNMRLQRAADLLDKKAGNVAEVAYQVGFNNLSYFAKCFREKFGETPSDYQKKIKV